jgi:hypothetical protein
MSAMRFLGVGVGVGVLDAVDVMMMNDEQYYLLWQVPRFVCGRFVSI